MTFRPVQGGDGHLLNQWCANISTCPPITSTCFKMQISRSYQLPFPQRLRFQCPRAVPRRLHFNPHHLLPPLPTPALSLRLTVWSPFEWPSYRRSGTPEGFLTEQRLLCWQSGNGLQGARLWAGRAATVITELVR